MKLKPIIVWPLCWTLYCVGHIASKVVDWLDTPSGHVFDNADDLIASLDSYEPPWYFTVAYECYQWPMVTSLRVQEWAEGGRENRIRSDILPWGPPSDEAPE